MTGPAAAIADTVAFLAKVDIFRELSPEDLRKIAAVLSEKAYEKGSRVFSAGDPGGSVYLIRAGIVHITRDQPGGGAIVLARLAQGEIFGEMSYVDRRPRSANAVAVARTTLLVGERERLDDLFGNDLPLSNKVLLGIVRKMSERLKKVDDQLEGFQDIIRYF